MSPTKVDTTDHRCPDCWVPPTTPHEKYCDVARCTECGFQRLDCDHASYDDAGVDGDVGWGQEWTGTWPGEADAERHGLWCLIADGRGWVPCPPGAADAQPDLNRLYELAADGTLVWNRDLQRWDTTEESGRL